MAYAFRSALFNDVFYYGDYVPSVMDERMIVEHWLRNNGRGKAEILRENPVLEPQNSTWTGLVTNPGRRAKRPATNRLCHGTTHVHNSAVTNRSNENVNPYSAGWPVCKRGVRWARICSCQLQNNGTINHTIGW